MVERLNALLAAKALPSMRVSEGGGDCKDTAGVHVMSEATSRVGVVGCGSEAADNALLVGAPYPARKIAV